MEKPCRKEFERQAEAFQHEDGGSAVNELTGNYWVLIMSEFVLIL